MSDILSYVYQGEWTENLQTKLNNWFTKQSRFLSEMEFEEKLFRDFITVMVKDKRRSMGEIKTELQEVSIDENQARDLAEDLGRVLKGVENSVTVPGMSRALQTSRGSTKQDITTDPVISDKGCNTNAARLLNSALQTSRGEASKNDKSQNSKRRDFSEDDTGSKRPRHINHGNQQYQHLNDSRSPYYNGNEAPLASTGSSAPMPGTIEYFEKMNELAKKSGFNNAQEMISAQQQMMAMMHSPRPGAGPLPPQPNSSMMPFHHNHMDPTYMGPSMMMPPHTDPQRIDYFPPHHYEQFGGYGGYPQDPRFQGRGYQGRGFQGRGRGGGRGRLGGRSYESIMGPHGAGTEKIPTPTPPVKDASNDSIVPPIPVPEVSQTTIHLTSAPVNEVPSQPIVVGGRGGQPSGRGFGGRFGHSSNWKTTPINNNPFISTVTPVVAAVSEQPQENMPTSPFAGRGFVNGRGFSGRVRPPAPVASNKVWVRKTDQQA